MPNRVNSLPWTRSRGVPALGAALALALASGMAQAADTAAAAGKALFAANCAACHSVVVGQNSFGPNLHGVFDRRAGTYPGFSFTPALVNSHLTWNAANLDAFFAAPSTKVPGTAMSISVGSAQDRANLIAYLKTLGPPDPPPASLAKAAAPLGSGPAQAELDAAEGRSDWLMTHKGYRAERYSPLDKINRANAAALRPSCMYQSGLAGLQQTFPIVYEGVIYLTSADATAAVSATTCEQLWLQVHKSGANLRGVNRGAAIAQGRLVRGTPDGRLLALNMKDGSVLWEVAAVSPQQSFFYSQPPMIVGDRVFIGPAGSDWGAEGWMGAFDLATGKALWRFNLVPKDGEPGSETWKTRGTNKVGGGAQWTAMAFDRANDLLLVPVANPSPDYNPQARPGDNLYTGSVVALHAATGKLAWFKQFVINDGHDYDMTTARPLHSGTVQGKQRNLLTIAGKDGLLRLLDRDTREVLYEKPISRQLNVDKPLTPAGVNVCPGSLGGVEWNGAAYMPASSTLYIGSVEWCGIYKSGPLEAGPGTGKGYYGGTFSPDGKPAGRLTAVDALTGELKWQQDWDTPLVAGLTTTAGGLLITGKSSGEFLVMDADSGKTLYSFRSGGGFGTGPVTYEVGGRQYIAAISGVISSFFAGRGTLELIVFELGPQLGAPAGSGK